MGLEQILFGRRYVRKQRARDQLRVRYANEHLGRAIVFAALRVPDVRRRRTARVQQASKYTWPERVGQLCNACSDQSYSFFVMDKTRNFFLLQVFSLPIVASGISIVNWGGRYFFIWLWLFVVAVSLATVTIFPVFIAPLMDKYTPLRAGPLKTKIEKLAETVGFPLLTVYIVEGNERVS